MVRTCGPSKDACALTVANYICAPSHIEKYSARPQYREIHFRARNIAKYDARPQCCEYAVFPRNAPRCRFTPSTPHREIYNLGAILRPPYRFAERSVSFRSRRVDFRAFEIIRLSRSFALFSYQGRQGGERFAMCIGEEKAPRNAQNLKLVSEPCSGSSTLTRANVDRHPGIIGWRNT